jgi:phage tail-like protein
MTAIMSALGGYPSFGMSMRFSVEVKGLENSRDLGLWQSCSQLEVDLNCEKFAQGGADLKNMWLPGNTEYSDVTLKRPMEGNSSDQVQEWLQKFVKGWENCKGAPYGNDPQTDSVIITLLDYRLYTVMSWTLKNAHPIKWTGPELSADGKNIAIETLIIQHDGFLEHTDVASRATLSTADGKSQVEFQFNPETVQVVHAPEIRVPVNDDGPASIIKLGVLSLTISDARFAGLDTLTKCEQLLNWTYVDPGQQTEGAEDLYLPPLIFKWGGLSILEHKSIKVTLTKADITYQRFDSTGKPTRALVHIELKCDNRPPPSQQNPTSGGLPGRKGHAMVSGETLPGIALGTYGSPARWRAVAAANQIDDPLRVRPGSMLLLPSRTELAGGGAA